MEESSVICEQIAERVVALIQYFACSRHRFAPPAHILQFKEQLAQSERRGRDRFADYPLLFRVFAALARRQTPPTMGELSAELGFPMSSTTRLVDWLVRAQIAARVSDQEDRRVVRVSLTERGQQFHNAMMEHNRKQVIEMIRRFSPDEQAQLLQLVTKLQASLLSEP